MSLENIIGFNRINKNHRVSREATVLTEDLHCVLFVFFVLVVVKEANFGKVKHIAHYNYQDYKNLEDNWELIDGIPFAMSPSAKILHQHI